MKNQQDLIIWLQNWYRQYCDGDWEHNQNVSIYTIDNPGWCVSIDLEGTNCEHCFFQDLEKEIDDNNWYHCFIRDGKFEGAGGPSNLVDILKVFEEWVTSIRSNT